MLAVRIAVLLAILAVLTSCSEPEAPRDGSMNDIANDTVSDTTNDQSMPDVLVFDALNDAAPLAEIAVDAAVDAVLVPDTASSCPVGMARCGSECVNTETDPMNCGSCAFTCTGGSGATAICDRGRCGIECRRNFANCDVNSANGCEVDLSFDIRNCGRCGNQCPTPPNSSPRCFEGRCNISCPVNFADCNGDATDGCETDTRTNSMHCGRCTNACRSGAGCSGGMCCPPGQLGCSGACIDVQTSTLHCGRCGNACGSMQTCNAGVCTCSSAFTTCGTNCANLQIDGANCGMCGRQCPPSTVCLSGTCQPFCTAEQPNRCPNRNVSGQTVCVDLRVDANYCGSCSIACAMGQSCVGGRCQ